MTESSWPIHQLRLLSRAEYWSGVTIRVILGEDSYLASEGVARVLDRADDIQLLSTQKDFDALVAAIEEQRPDVVLTDIRMPPTHSDEGIRLADELRASSPEIGVVA
jgi:DNA-binding NarL/FixJ family response regulator